MATLKTRATTLSVTEFLSSVADENKRRDCRALLKLMKNCTGEKPVLWGNGVVGFGRYHYKSERSKQEGDWYMTGFSPRKTNLTIYIMPGFGKYKGMLAKLGKYKTAGACLYLNTMADIDEKVLAELVTAAFGDMKQKYK